MAKVKTARKRSEEQAPPYVIGAIGALALGLLGFAIFLGVGNGSLTTSGIARGVSSSATGQFTASAPESGLLIVIGIGLLLLIYFTARRKPAVV